MKGSFSRLAVVLSVVFAPGALFGQASGAAFQVRADDPLRAASRVYQSPSRGFYSLSVEGPAGSSASVADRMNGSFGAASAPSSSADKGRPLNLFLDAGEYRVDLSKPLGGGASASLLRFREKPELDLLADADGRASQGVARAYSLSDKELQSFKFRVDGNSKRFRFLALGRSLGGVYLFRDGEWLRDARPAAMVVDGDAGRPRTAGELNLELPPGEYQAVCVGAPALPWSGAGGAADAASESALFVQWGAQSLDEIGVWDLRLGPSGLESYLIPARAGLAQATVDEGASIVLGLADQGASRFGGAAAATDKKGGYRAAALRGRGSPSWLTLRGAPGTRVQLRLVPESRGGSAADIVDTGNGGPAALRALGSVEGEDAVPLTAAAWSLKSAPQGRWAGESFAGRVLELGPDQPLRLKGNFLSRNFLFLDVKAPGKYAVSEREGGKQSAARWTFVPFAGWSLDRKNARSVSRGGAVDLAPGRYVLEAEADKGGAADVLIAKDGLFASIGAWDKAPDLSGPEGNQLFLDGKSLPPTGNASGFAFGLGERSGVVQGYSLRPLPADLGEAPYAAPAAPGKASSFPVYLKTPGRLRAWGGAAWTVDGAPLDPAKVYAPGAHQAVCSAPAAKDKAAPAWVGLEALAPPPAAAGEPYLSLEEGASLDFAKGETKRLAFTVPENGFYVLSSSGRLKTSIALSSPLRPAFAVSSGGGPGRNARLSAYLRAGRYLAEFTAQGASAGWAALRLERRPLRELGALTDEGVLRATVPAESAAALDVVVTAPGSYLAKAEGLGRSFGFRFEDAGGWLLGSPGDQSFRSRLAPGSYRLYSLDDRVDTRRVFTLSALADSVRSAAAPEGKRFAVDFDRDYRRSWKGPGPDEASVTVPAALSAVLTLPGDLSFKQVDPDGKESDGGLGGSPLTLNLKAGTTRLLISPLVDDQDKPYSLRLACPALFEGRVLGASPGAVLPVAIPAAGNWEISTRGGAELEAALFAPGPKGYRLAARSAPIPDDWNCRVAARLEAGLYYLKFAVPGDARLGEVPARPSPASGGSSTVTLRQRPQAAGVSASVPFSLGPVLGDEYAAADFSVPAAGPYRLRVRAQGPADFFLERDGRTVCSGNGEALVLLSPGSPYRLRWGRYGEGRAEVFASCAPLAVEARSLGSDASISSGADAVLLKDPSGLSRRLEGGAFAAASLAPGAREAVFAPLGADCARLDGAYLVRLSPGADGASAAFGSAVAAPAAFAGPSSALSLPLGSGGQRLGADVAPSSVGLLRVVSPEGAVSATEFPGAAERADALAVDWRSASLGPARSVLGIGPGRTALGLRDSRPAPDGRRVSALWDEVPVAFRAPAAAGFQASRRLDGRSAAAFDLGPVPVRAVLALEKGLAAFIADKGLTRRSADALDATASFDFSGAAGTLYVVNVGAVPAAFDLAVSAAAPASAETPAVTERVPWEGTGPGRVRLSVAAAEASSGLSVFGAVSGLRFFDEETGTALDLSGAERREAGGLSYLSLPGRKGLLELDLAGGPARASLSRPEDAAFRLLDGAAAKRGFSVPSGGAVATLSSDRPGWIGLLDASGRPVALALGRDRPSLAALLAPGSYSAAARSYSAGATALDLRFPKVEEIAASGEGEAAIAVPGEVRVHRFSVARDGRVGVALRAEADGLKATLRDASFKPLAEGPLLVRDLKAGTYYLCVEAPDRALRYRPAFAGLEGSLADVPEDVAASYLKSGE